MINQSYLHYMLSMHFSLRQSNRIESTERNVMSSCGKTLTSTSSMRIHTTKAAPSLLLSTTRASSRWKAQAVYTGVNFQVPIPTRQRRSTVVVQITEPLAGASSCLLLPRPKGEGSASSQGDRSCGSRCGCWPPLRPPLPLWQPLPLQPPLPLWPPLLKLLQPLTSRHWPGGGRGERDRSIKIKHPCD